MNVNLTKISSGFIPTDPSTRDWWEELKDGQVVHADFKKVRNYSFLKKYFALLNTAYNYWEPGEVNSKYGVPEKNFDRFRADLTILAGFYENTVRLDGTVRIEPKSISFAKMDEEEFERLYNKTIDVLLKYVYGKEMSRDDIDKLVNEILEFV